MNTVRKVALVIAIVGCINWLTIGLFDFNIVGFLFDDISTAISRVIYSLVGLSGLVCISYFFDHHNEF